MRILNVTRNSEKKYSTKNIWRMMSTSSNRGLFLVASMGEYMIVYCFCNRHISCQFLPSQGRLHLIEPLTSIGSKRADLYYCTLHSWGTPARRAVNSDLIGGTQSYTHTVRRSCASAISCLQYGQIRLTFNHSSIQAQ